MHGHVPAAGHNSGLGGKEEAGKVLPKAGIVSFSPIPGLVQLKQKAQQRPYP